MSYHPRTRQLLEKPCGLAPRELRALELTPFRTVRDVPTGYGLIGGTGVGKTFALVRHAADRVEQIVQACPLPSEARLPFAWATWENWPERAEEIKRLSTKQGRDLEEWIQRAKVATCLYLDDLGRERIKGEDDFSLGVLAEIVDHRYRQGSPVFWTSNLGSPDEFGKIYPGRMVSRLLSTWPPFLLRGEDLRLSAGAKVVDFKQRAAGGDA